MQSLRLCSAGAFVATFVVGCVALTAAPFPVPARAFSRDLLFYLTAAVLVLLVYMSGTVYLWQAVGFVLYYTSFVALVVATDLRAEPHAKYGGSPTVAEKGQADAFQVGKRQLSDDPTHQVTPPPCLLQGGRGWDCVLRALSENVVRGWVQLRVASPGGWRRGSEGTIKWGGVLVPRLWHVVCEPQDRLEAVGCSGSTDAQEVLAHSDSLLLMIFRLHGLQGDGC